MLVKDAKEIIKDMDLSPELNAKVEGMLSGKSDSEELDENLMNQILAMIDTEYDAANEATGTDAEEILDEIGKEKPKDANGEDNNDQ